MKPLALVLLTSLASSSVLGGETTPTPTPYRVFVPIDKEKQPSGGTVYVPEGLYKELNELAAGPTRASQGWMLEEATYRGELAWQATPKRLVLDELRASYRLRAFGPGAKQVRIALHREEITLPTDGVLLDGRGGLPRMGSRGQGAVDSRPRFRACTR